MDKYVWTFELIDPDSSDEPLDTIITWSAWEEFKDFKDCVLDSVYNRVTEGFDRGLTDPELMSIRDQLNFFFTKDVRYTQENTCHITLDNHGTEEDVIILRVWTISIISNK